MRSFLPALAAASLAGLMPACGDDETPPQEPTNLGASSLRFTHVGLRPAADAACVPWDEDAWGERSVDVQLATENVWLRPEGFCENVIQCGLIEMSVDGTIKAYFASPTFRLEGRWLAAPFGEHTLSARVLQESGEYLANPREGEGEGETLPTVVSATATIVFAASCP